MDRFYSKKSSIKDNTVVYETLDRGHNSEITRIRHKNKTSLSGRRMFTFVGSAGRHQNKSLIVRPVTPKTHTPKARTLRSRSRSRSARKKPSSVQQSVQKRSSRTPSQASSVRRTDEQVAVISPIPEILAPPKDPPSPGILVEEKPADSQAIDDKDERHSSDEEAAEEEEEQISISPSVVGYRKLVYDESRDKWIEYWKLEEDAKRASKKLKTKRLLEKLKAERFKPKVHPVKGRITARMQVMFPTAVVKADRKHAYYNNNILMTDQLRVELHKRRAPIVPSYYQEHIIKFGKLPFRNNPRTHPIVFIT